MCHWPIGPFVRRRRCALPQEAAWSADQDRSSTGGIGCFAWAQKWWFNQGGWGLNHPEREFENLTVQQKMGFTYGCVVYITNRLNQWLHEDFKNQERVCGMSWNGGFQVAIQLVGHLLFSCQRVFWDRINNITRWAPPVMERWFRFTPWKLSLFSLP